MRYNIVEMCLLYGIPYEIQWLLQHNGCYNAKLQTFIVGNLSKTI